MKANLIINISKPSERANPNTDLLGTYDYNKKVHFTTFHSSSFHAAILNGRMKQLPLNRGDLTKSPSKLLAPPS